MAGHALPDLPVLTFQSFNCKDHMVVNNCVDCDKEIETIDLRCEQCRLARYEWLLAEQEAEKEAILTKMQEIKEEAYE